MAPNLSHSQQDQIRDMILGNSLSDVQIVSVAGCMTTYSISRALKEAGWSKKAARRIAQERSAELRDFYLHTLSDFPSYHLVYIDESGYLNPIEELFCKTKLGAGHPDTLTSMGNLASTYWNQGRWEEAETLQMQVMETFETKLGADHPDTLTSMANLASTYHTQGRSEEAEELQAKQLEMRAKKLGHRLPDTLISMMNLAYIWKDMGRHEDALGLLQTCFDLRQQVLGVGHPYTASMLSTLKAWLEENEQPPV
ncbi:hypothetical protein C8A03DRAFT_48277 [Achaetomium macrosporum]|uniref:Kinesin light chain n=1 Tax=Achaetomium macrosporum TaxID=79813 RepID=A0AAN7C0G9_9PEZI|nr:hypothetical protein C8A03DRAFT_48277 [Achaetomium macrosporum]